VLSGDGGRGCGVFCMAYIPTLYVLRLAGEGKFLLVRGGYLDG